MPVEAHHILLIYSHIRYTHPVRSLKNEHVEDVMRRHPENKPIDTDSSQREGAAYWICLYVIVGSALIGSALRQRVHATRMRRHVMMRMRAPENVPVIHRIHLLDNEITTASAALCNKGLDPLSRARDERRIMLLAKQRDVAARMVFAPTKDPTAAMYRAMCRDGNLAALARFERSSEPIWRIDVEYYHYI